MKQENHCNCPLCGQAFTPADGMTANEHLTRGVLKAYADMQKVKNEHDSPLPCPRCGGNSMSSNVLRNALSRQFDIHICDACGNLEVVEASAGTPLPLESWWAIAEILKQK